ncbi:zinc finger HIT domain-containing protein [Halobellus litoreus]|uniref:Zinc finger HIT domain-containing protein n=1 Tax=Halobellus litoreus TaxID=755310 RepID=A0ABD6DX04_9EURY|nr:zinc finger HIT domain-containing protein [Halobellus litoreus]
MSVTGVCQVCERREAEYACHRCGAAVCSVHFETEQGVCVHCADPEGREDVFAESDAEGEVPEFR